MPASKEKRLPQWFCNVILLRFGSAFLLILPLNPSKVLRCMNSAVKKSWINKKALVLLVLLSPSVWGQVSGVVRSPTGETISGAVVEVVGTNISIRADAHGHFVVPALNTHELELHVKAPMYMHKTFHLDGRKEQVLELILNPTV